MNLETPSQENLNFMLTEITTKLKMVNVGVFENLELDSVDYNALIDIYQLIKRKSTFSPREMQLFAEELRRVRK
ncbi:TPA: DUF1128 domain-containing protein [Listeria monocytogenes]|uniref:DUF1128 domain-containing protein n=3 Tax=Listeria monocytogenes TaxID=1639 RepID=A0A3T2LWP7_LISMN|nr:DUF1128 domain-containing protein [Listeria monocytogenes]EAD3236527.1 DUF1128 domain-containing protein [Listeria monocytogenes CFSAN002202]EAD5039611.1 DUF1128 domain-containing protein [Listeria monocytogenes serotype 1/2a]EAE6022952.1 DUF1128 domain-containing protein [Listeria monocytogenes serotype 3a]EAF4502688.1 DUF1128 domain-containing protein [Listeria monocytogenes serotype 4b]EAG6257301.1 DUF1128 domain-containing protein [Listeria monocytogenes CFSAN003807]EAG6284827.1 DUF112